MGFFFHLSVLSLAVLGVSCCEQRCHDRSGNTVCCENMIRAGNCKSSDGTPGVCQDKPCLPVDITIPNGCEQKTGRTTFCCVPAGNCQSSDGTPGVCQVKPCLPGDITIPNGCEKRTRRTTFCCVPATIFVGPYDHGWEKNQCSWLGHHNETNLSECKSLCTQTQTCTALGILDNPSACVLVSCPWPVPLPQRKYTGHDQAYAIAEVCGTESKCGIKGGFCIPGNETCNGKTITEEGYCNANYDKQINQMGCKCCLKPTVYMRDIENTIAYALRNRAPYNFTGPPPAIGSVYRTLNTSQQETLSNFTKALVHHLPLRPSLVSFLNCLSGNLSTSNGKSIKGQDLLLDIYRGCKSDTDLPYVREWVNCKNFDSPDFQSFRSYPCGVWTTFHAMTVNLTDGDQQDVPRILPTLHGMVNYFPWCHMCQQNFLNRYRDQHAENMTTPYEVTMWLWRTHNEVNVNETTINEPNRPKSVFPDFKLCPDCWELVNKENPFEFATITNDTEVWSYLRDHYKWNAIVQDTQDELEAEVTINI